ncbi:MAG: hypothetical protein QXP53_02860 [Candidatus Pacearchaeota archaeon]
MIEKKIKGNIVDALLKTEMLSQALKNFPEIKNNTLIDFELHI